MTTSANTSDYVIYNKNGDHIGDHHQHWMCSVHWEELLKYQPLKDYTIKETWYDEDEEYDEDKPENLEIFLKKRERSSKELFEYFKKKPQI